MSLPEPQNVPSNEAGGPTSSFLSVVHSAAGAIGGLLPSNVRPAPAELDTRRPAPSEGLLGDFSMKAAHLLDRAWGWHRLPMPLAALTLMGLRMTLRRENLFDPSGTAVPWGPEVPTARRSLTRSLDGSGGDPYNRAMGSAGSVFGRNVPLTDTVPHDEHEPNARTVSNELLDRGGNFIAASSLNLLMAAWIQFEVHDWMSHGPNDPEEPWDIPLQNDDHFPGAVVKSGKRVMQVRRTHLAPGDQRPTYRNTQSHWWDASQVYGSTRELGDSLRTRNQGHLRLSPTQLVPFDPPNEDVPKELEPAKGSWWVGLAMFHTLFMREHNAICDRLADAHPDWDDERLYQTARLVNAALIAKIHTLEWTRALLANPRTELALWMNWWGLQGRHVHKWIGRLTANEEWSGIPGSDLYYHGVPYALTEEFLAVYRMHPLIPDDFTIRSSMDGRFVENLTFEEVSRTQTRDVLANVKMDDLFYSFGVSHPGAVVLHNYPTSLRRFSHPDGIIDLATIDILRDRERGVPRYNDFRRRFRLRPVTRFEDFSADPKVVDKLRHLYGNPEMVDLMVGLYTEEPPQGFAISDTAFRVFILMASRRLKSDRFFTYDYRPEVYSKEGLEWINRTTLASVLTRHYPDLQPLLGGVNNVFKPWDSEANRKPHPWLARAVDTVGEMLQASPGATIRATLPIRQGVWNLWTRVKFAAVKPLSVPVPNDDEQVTAIDFAERYPRIPISGLIVADRFPKDEYKKSVRWIVKREQCLAHTLLPTRDGRASIHPDPHRALGTAYPKPYRRLYRAPSRPPGYDPVDLGQLAVASPYAYLLRADNHGTLQWDLRDLDRYERHPELLPPGVRVEFAVEGDGLRATSIDSALGSSRRGDRDWAAAQRLAMCAAATHTTLVRHFNWIHLVAGERLAIATHRRLPSSHPVRRLLQPHIYATHFGNLIVTPSQLEAGGDFERLFSYTHRGLWNLFEETARQFDIRTMDPDEHLALNDVAHLGIDQPALANRRRLMAVIGDHVTRYLAIYYQSDAEIAADQPLARWIDELAAIPGVRQLAPSPLTRRAAVKVLAAFIYMVTVDHEIIDSGVWDYQLWSDVQAPRVYRDGRTLPLDVYQRLVNTNFILNVDRTLLMSDFSYLALDLEGARAFLRFRDDLAELQRKMDREEAYPWRIEPRNLKANINY